MSSCKRLPTLNLTGFSQVTKISDIFLNGCSSLVDLDLSGLTGVTSVGDNFLFNTNALETLKVSFTIPPKTIAARNLTSLYLFGKMQTNLLNVFTTEPNEDLSIYVPEEFYEQYLELVQSTNLEGHIVRLQN